MLQPIRQRETIATTGDIVVRRSLFSTLWFMLLCIPATVYIANISRWSLDLDEIYTLRDSSQPIVQIITFEKPIYYLICHLLLKLAVPDAIAIRLPAAVAAGALAPTCYLLGRRVCDRRTAMFASVLVAANAWYFQISQFGRFYSLTVLLSLMAILALYGFMREAKWRWLVGAIVFATLATATHTTAVVLFPAGTIALSVSAWHRSRSQLVAYVRRYAIPGVVLASCCLLLIVLGVNGAFRGWIGAQHGQYGNYVAAQVVLGFVLFTGLQVWALAFFPLLQRPSGWSTAEVFFSCLLLSAVLPFIILSPLGGGVAPRYLLAATPALFMLAGRGWNAIDAQIDSCRLRWALAATILAMNVPMVLSTLRDGNHCDYRAAVAFVEQCDAVDPIVLCTAHELYRYYAKRPAEVYELHTLADWTTAPSADGTEVQRNLVARVDAAQAAGRPLFLVSREDRRQLSDDVQQWISNRFRVLKTIEKPRFDHRRNQMVVYEYSPHEMPEAVSE